MLTRQLLMMGGVRRFVVPIAPAIDQPVVTSGAGQNGPGFSTQTVHTFKRIGDATTAVDNVNDTKFAYPGVPVGTLLPGATNNLLRGSLIPGGSDQSRRWDTQFEFVTSSKFVLFSWLTASAAPRLMVVVNGQWISPSFTTTGVAGGDSYVQMEFPDRSSRRIKISTSGGNQIRNVQVESAHPPVRPPSAGTLLGTIGDSLTSGSGEPPGYASALDTWPQAMALMLGFDHCCNAAIGGTKWVPRSDGTADQNTSHFGGGRLTSLLALNPSAIVYAGSRNDSGVDQAALDAIASAVSDAMTATTVTKKFVMGTFTNIAQNGAVRAGVGSVPFVDMSDGLSVADLGVDGIHPTYDGAVALRNRIAPRLWRAGCRP